MPEKYIVGLTGGIGSGKSTVGNAFRQLGITVVDADQCARVVVEPGTEALKKIAGHFGEEILLADGNLDRARLREVVFADDAQRQWLEGLLHPIIFDEILRQLQGAESPYAILESPLLVESGQSTICHRVLVVDLPEETQLARAMQRDDADEQQIRAIMAAQATRSDRLEKADDTIDNSGQPEELLPLVRELDKQYRQIAGS